MRIVIPTRRSYSGQSSNLAESSAMEKSTGVLSSAQGHNMSNGTAMATTSSYHSEVQQDIPRLTLTEEERQGRSKSELSTRDSRTPLPDENSSSSRPRSVTLTRYSSPRDVMRRVSARRGSFECIDNEKLEQEASESGEVTRLREEVASKNITINSLREDIRRLESQKKHLQHQLCESDSFIEKRVAELSRKSDDSRLHRQSTLEENQRLRRQVEVDASTIAGLREDVRRFEMKFDQLEAQKAEFQDKLRVANEVVAAHQSQALRDLSSSPTMGPLRHENEMLRQQLERQEREITTLRRELGPARFILDGRSRSAVPSATDRLDTLLENMETSVGNPVPSADLHHRHEEIMLRAKAALKSMHEENAIAARSASPVLSPMPDLHNGKVFSKHHLTLPDQYRAPTAPHKPYLQPKTQHYTTYSREPSAKEQYLYRFLEQQEQTNDRFRRRSGESVESSFIATDSVSPAGEVGRPFSRSRSPGVDRLLAKYRGGPTAATETRVVDVDAANSDDDDSPRPNLTVTVYSLGRKIHDAESGPSLERGHKYRPRAMSADNLHPVDHHSSLDTLSGEDNMGLWSGHSNLSAVRTGAGNQSTEFDAIPPPRSSISSPLNDRFNATTNAKVYANSLIERYIADRRR